jgi:hypothetical protein
MNASVNVSPVLFWPWLVIVARGGGPYVPLGPRPPNGLPGSRWSDSEASAVNALHGASDPNACDPFIRCCVLALASVKLDDSALD